MAAVGGTDSERVSRDINLAWVCVGGFFEGYGDHRDLHRVDRRQRQMCIRDRTPNTSPSSYDI